MVFVMSSTVQHLQKRTNKTHTLSSKHITVSNFHHIQLLPSIGSAIAFRSAYYTEPYFGGQRFYLVLFNLGKVNLWFQHDNLKLFIGVLFVMWIVILFIWCLLDHASLWKLKNKKPTRCHLLYHCVSYRLNMFQALLCQSLPMWQSTL